MAVIVVGVDGSEHAQRALEWAVDEATLRRARLRVVHALRPREAYYPYSMVGEPSREAADEVHRAVEEMLEEAVQRAGPPAQLQVETAAVEGLPPQVLVDQAKDADLLVVGSRGRGGFAGLLLGSVSQQCVHHATCPVVVLPVEL